MAEFIGGIFLLFLGLILLGLMVISLVWAYNDAEKRGRQGCLVVILLFLFSWPFSLLLWIVFRPDLPD
ncbi:MAG: hypothetical protein WBB73_00215 [Candidatus Aminicenantaceae bacterium]